MLQPPDIIDLAPKRLFQSTAAPRGPLPPPPNAQNSSELQRLVSVNLLNDTFRQIDTSQVDGLGGKIDLLG